jgi:hypothetical protein
MQGREIERDRAWDPVASAVCDVVVGRPLLALEPVTGDRAVLHPGNR